MPPARPSSPPLRTVLLLLTALTPFLSWSPSAVSGQEPATTGSILGRVRDADGAAVYAVDVRLVRADTLVRTTASDALGFFRVDDLPAAVYELRVGRLGYEERVLEVAVVAGGQAEVSVELNTAAVAVEGVSVEAERSRERVRFEEVAGITAREISREDVKRIPGVAEADPLRAIAVLPGVVATSDLSAAYHVRGGSSDQNLVLLDGVPVFSPFHLGGVFSVFNADLLDRAELQTGGFPAEHGSRVSSVLLLETDAGDGDFRIDGGVSFLASRIAMGGGLSSDLRETLGLSAGRWRLSARRSYFDVLLKPIFDFPYHLTDLQAVFEGWTSGGDRVDVTAYHGRDLLNLTSFDADDFPLRIRWGWGNDVVGARWVRPYRDGGSLSLSAGFTRFGSGLGFPDFGDTDFSSDVDQLTLGTVLDLRPVPTLGLTLGLDADRFDYRNRAVSGGTTFNEGRGSGWQLGGFAQTDWRRSGEWLVEAGLRVDGWRPSPGEPVAVVSPRLAIKRFFARSSWAVKVAGGRYAQFLHSLRDEELPLGLDIWVLSGRRAPHVVSDQLQLGVEGFPRDDWQVSLEGYVRSFDGVVTFSASEDPNDPLDDILAGDGASYGVDLLVRRNGGPVNGWLSLSWLKAERTFEDALSPFDPRPRVTYSPVFDRRWDADLVLQFPLPAGWSGGLRWNLGTGVPYTRAVASYAYYQPRFVIREGRLEWSGGEDGDDGLGGFAVLLGDRNGERYPTYHRMDVSFRKEIPRSWGTLTPYVDVLNVYNHKNVLLYFYDYDRNPPVRSGISMFPFLPSVGLEVSFR